MNARREPGSDSDDEVPPQILVVEDEFLQRNAIASELRDRGALVAEAANADEAWRYLASGYPVDLVFTDHQMPGSMTGAQLAARIRAEYPKIDVIVVSGNRANVKWTEPVVSKPYPLDRTAADLARRALDARRKGLET
jgi:CheY-like chemotaxis protein